MAPDDDGTIENYFFVCGSPNEDMGLIKRFHADLERELREQLGRTACGLLRTRPHDLEIRGTVEGLKVGADSIRCMVALCSDLFLEDNWSGQEWAVFAQRVAQLRYAATELEDGLLALIWDPCRRPVPSAAVAAELERGKAGMPRAYARLGIVGLMRTKLRGPDGYYAAVRAVAARIVAATRTDLPRTGTDLSRIEPAFGPQGLVPARPTEPRRRQRGPAVQLPLPRAGGQRIAISYVGADQEWADWVEALLRRRERDCDVVQVRWTPTRPESLTESVGKIREEDAGTTVVLLSERYQAQRPQTPDRGIEKWEVLGDEWPLPSRLVRVRIDKEPLPEPLRSQETVKLTNLDDDTIDGFLAMLEPVSRRDDEA